MARAARSPAAVHGDDLRAGWSDGRCARPRLRADVHDHVERVDAAYLESRCSSWVEARSLGWRVRRRLDLRCHCRPWCLCLCALRSVGLSALDRRLGPGRRADLTRRHHMSAAVFGGLPVVRARGARGDSGEGLAVPFLERRVPRNEAHLQGADDGCDKGSGALRARGSSSPEAGGRSGSVTRVEAKHDVLVVGAGCAGMRAAIEAFDAGADVAMISKIHPVRSHSGAAEGGINAALGNASEDDPEKHAFDTVKGSDYLGDQDAIEILCEEAPDDVYQLEHWGAVFSRTADGRIAQRPFGAAGEPRTAYAADITGHVLIHVLYEQVMKRDIKTYEEFFAWKLVIDEGRCQGVIAWDLLDGGLKSIGARTAYLDVIKIPRKKKVVRRQFKCQVGIFTLLIFILLAHSKRLIWYYRHYFACQRHLSETGTHRHRYKNPCYLSQSTGGRYPCDRNFTTLR